MKRTMERHRNCNGHIYELANIHDIVVLISNYLELYPNETPFTGIVAFVSSSSKMKSKTVYFAKFILKAYCMTIYGVYTVDSYNISVTGKCIWPVYEDILNEEFREDVCFTCYKHFKTFD
uniref:Uncharacterized protein n=1 Tax=Glossina brevipalpis TaxID=37001 RepID=A0A1A9W7K4_9MUSC